MKTHRFHSENGRVTLLLPQDVIDGLDSRVARGAGRNRSALAAELLRCALQHRAGHSENGSGLGIVAIRYDSGIPGTVAGILAAENAAPGLVGGVSETPAGGSERLRVAQVRGNLAALSALAAAFEAVRGVLRVQLTVSKVWDEPR